MCEVIRGLGYAPPKMTKLIYGSSCSSTGLNNSPSGRFSWATEIFGKYLIWKRKHWPWVHLRQPWLAHGPWVTCFVYQIVQNKRPGKNMECQRNCGKSKWARERQETRETESSTVIFRKMIHSDTLVVKQWLHVKTVLDVWGQGLGYQYMGYCLRSWRISHQVSVKWAVQIRQGLIVGVEGLVLEHTLVWIDVQKVSRSRKVTDPFVNSPFLQVVNVQKTMDQAVAICVGAVCRDLNLPSVVQQQTLHFEECFGSKNDCLWASWPKSRWGITHRLKQNKDFIGHNNRPASWIVDSPREQHISIIP